MRSKGGNKFEVMCREKGSSKMVGNSPWGPWKGPKKLKKNMGDVCCEYLRCEGAVVICIFGCAMLVH